MYNMPGHFLQSLHLGFPIQNSILCMCFLQVQWSASFPIPILKSGLHRLGYKPWCHGGTNA